MQLPAQKEGRGERRHPGPARHAAQSGAATQPAEAAEPATGGAPSEASLTRGLSTAAWRTAQGRIWPAPGRAPVWPSSSITFGGATV